MFLLTTAMAQQFQIGPLDPSCDFSTQWALNGNGGCSGSGVYLLNFNGTRGAVWWDEPVPVGPDIALRTAFRVAIPCGNFCPSGFTFTLQNEGVDALGQAGLGLGYLGIDDSVAVEFDLFSSGGTDFPAPNHVGLNLDGSIQSQNAAMVFTEFRDTFHVWIDYHPASQTLDVFVENDPNKPNNPNFSTNIDLQGHLGTTAWLGFTGGTDFGSMNTEIRIESLDAVFDLDADGDGLLAFEDDCDLDPVDAPIDVDCDGVPDPADQCPGSNDSLDMDSDGIPDGCDLCPMTPGGQNDDDGDGEGNACDDCPFDAANDLDGDGVCGDVDVCPGFDDLLDTDGDGAPDCLDICPQDGADDSDGDGACDSDDNCPGVPNPDQGDSDDDGLGDLCDPNDDTETADTAETDTDEDTDTPPDTDAPPDTDEPGDTGCRDCDGDGFDLGVDCDDDDPSIHPGAFEPDDPIDHDCDGNPAPELSYGCGCRTATPFTGWLAFIGRR